MGDILSDKNNSGNILKRNPISKIMIKCLAAVVAILIILLILSYVVPPLFGLKFIIFSNHPRIEKIIKYSKRESAILNILLKETVTQNSIPQLKFLEKESGIVKSELLATLESLADKGDIALDDSGTIVDVYPWTVRNTGIEVFIADSDYQDEHRLKAAGALYAMSVSSLYDLESNIVAKFSDTGANLKIEISNNEIQYTSNIGTIIYRAENYCDSRFFATSDGARAFYGDQFDVNRLIRLDRGLLIGDIIAAEIKDKIEW